MSGRSSSPSSWRSEVFRWRRVVHAVACLDLMTGRLFTSARQAVNSVEQPLARSRTLSISWILPWRWREGWRPWMLRRITGNRGGWHD